VITSADGQLPGASRELVLASAGTGKTYRITSRLIALLAHDVDPEHILAASFTRKAAGEILDRTLKRLADAALDPAAAAELSIAATLEGHPAPPVEPKHWAGVLERVVAGLHRLNVGTLDSFFMRAASAFQRELALPPGWRVADSSALARLRSDALEDLLSEVDPAILLKLLSQINHGNAHRSVHDNLLSQVAELLDVARQLDPAAADPWRAFASTGARPAPSEAERISWAEAIETAPIPVTKAGKPHTGWANAVQSVGVALREGNWEALVRLGPCQKILTGESSFHKHSLDDIRAVLEPGLEAAAAALKGRYAGKVEALGELVSHYESRLLARQAETGEFGFDDVTRLLGLPDPLAERSDVFHRLDARIQHVLLDEFQDTSLAQWEALESLLDQVLTAAGHAGVIVADPKQSIYSWRGAEPGIVHMVGALHSLPEAELSDSRRSSDVVLRLVNQLFAGISELPILQNRGSCQKAAVEWRRDFKAQKSALGGVPGYTNVSVGPRGESASESEDLKFSQAAALVRDLHLQSPKATIGILTRTNDSAAQVIFELRERGIHPSEEGGTPLTDSGSCEAILALLRLADHPGDTIARYHVSKSALGTTIAYADHTDDNAARDLARRVRGELLDLGYGAWLQQRAGELAAFCDARELRRLLQLVELGFRHASISTLRPGDFIRFVEAQKVEDPTRANIRVMTIHGAKGLEFDIVVLADLDEPLVRPSKAHVFPHRPEPGRRARAVLPAIPADLRCLYPDAEAAYAQAEEAAMRDALSVLYVAVTRARHELRILITPDHGKDVGTALTAARLLRESLEPGSDKPRKLEGGETLYEEGMPDWSLEIDSLQDTSGAAPVTRRAPIRLARSARTRMFPRQSPSQMEGGARVNPAHLLSLANTSALARGSIVHAWFEQFRWIQDPRPAWETLRKIAYRHDPRIAEEEIERLRDDFERWLSAPAIAAALSRSSYSLAPELRNESRFLHLENGTLMEGSIDRLVLLRDGDRVVAAEVLDFKTDRFGGDEALINARVEHYRPQLLAYARAVKAIHRLPAEAVRTRLVLLDAGLVIDLYATVTDSSALLDSENSPVPLDPIPGVAGD
jgi:ATP-dependent helicase/nuclease subunit A